jgi:hypothetical protein
MTMQWLRVDEDDLDAIERDPDLAGVLMADREPLDVGRAWHGLHALLNGSPWGGEGAAFDAVLGGTALGDPSTYEPVRALLPERVAAVATLLTDTGVDELRTRFTHARFRQWEVYPDEAWEAPDALTAFLAPAYETLRGLFTEAAAAGDGMLIRLV